MPESNWLEHELRAGLHPVTAPAGLWSRIQKPKGPRRQRFLWPVIAILMLLASADLLWEFSKARGGLRQIAQPTRTELASIAAGAEQCDFLSNDPAHLRQWVKSRSGLEIELPAHSPAVRVIGAKVVTLRGMMVASVSYETADHRGSMLVWRGTEWHVRHAAPLRSGHLVSWSQGDNVFAAIGPDEASTRGACMLCHPEGTHGI